MTDRILHESRLDAKSGASASTYHPVLDLTPEGEVIRQARRELANRYGSRGTTQQLRAALVVLTETARGAQ